MDVQSRVGWVYSLKYGTMMLFEFTLPPIFPKLGPHLQRCNSVMVHPYAHPQHMKVHKHLHYIQFGCEIQSGVVYSLKHDTMMLFDLTLTPNFSKIRP